MAGALLVAFAASVGLIKCVDHLRNAFDIQKEPQKVLVTGAAEDIGYAILPMIARGLMLGADQPVILHMLDTDAGELKKIRMELIDAAFPLLKDVVATTKVGKACEGFHVAVMIGVESEPTFKAQAKALGENCKVLVVANRVETKALELEKTQIRHENITYLTRLEHNRALSQIAKKANVHVSDVKNVIIRENRDSTLFPDVHYVTTTEKGKNVKEWLKNELEDIMRQRDAANSRATKRSSALSTASSACDHVRDWLLGTPEGTCVSMGVYYHGSYGSFPVTCDGKGNWRVKRFDETTMKPSVDKKPKK